MSADLEPGKAIFAYTFDRQFVLIVPEFPDGTGRIEFRFNVCAYHPVDLLRAQDCLSVCPVLPCSRLRGSPLRTYVYAHVQPTLWARWNAHCSKS